VSKPVSYGLIVEGPYDEMFYRALIPRICGMSLMFETRVCRGVHGLVKNLATFLRTLEWVHQGLPVDKVLVIHDSDRKDLLAAREEMARQINGKKFAFPHGIQLCAIRRAMEAWLLADVNAINTVAVSRGGREVPEVTGSPEDLQDPKMRLRFVLSSAGIEYTAAVCGEIARNLRIEVLEYRCPSFRSFKQSVLDC
jgi:hypothetical protein